MKKRISVVLLMIVVFAVSACAYAADNVPRGVLNATKSIVRITVNTPFGTEEHTGIVIGKGKEQYVLTNLSSLDGHKGDMFVGGTDEQKIKVSGVIASSKEKDLAVLGLTEKITEVKTAKLKTKDIENGKAVYALEYFSRHDNSLISEGVINSVNAFKIDGTVEETVYQITAQITEKNSGGGLVDENGNVVGVNLYDGNLNQNKALTSSEVIEFLNEKEVPYKKATILYILIIAVLVVAVIGFGIYLIVRTLKKKKENEPVLIGVCGEFSGQRIPVGSDNISIGRDAKYCQVVVLTDKNVSRCHCSIHYDKIKDKFVLTDLASTHGTYTSKTTKLEPKVPVYISSGEVFRVGDGNIAFRVSVGGEY